MASVIAKSKRSETEIAGKQIANYDRNDKTSIHLLDIERFGLTAQPEARRRQEWSTAAKTENGGEIHPTSFGTGIYVILYRAMKTDEYYHLRKFGHLPQGLNGHQGLGPNRSYSHDYLKNDYTHLIEFEFPSNFMKEMYQQGWKEGSLEAGCLAWGLAVTHKNSWKNDATMGFGTEPNHKNQARTPYEIYMNWKHAIRWKLVNVQIPH